MRTQRHSAVQTKEQYELVHRAIAQLFEKQLQLYEIHGAQQIADGNEITTGAMVSSTDSEKQDSPPPKPPRTRSCLVEGDAKEEILQPPEPHPVPPILTPSPPSAFPTVTTVWQDSDRYHPKPVLHMASPEQHPADLNRSYDKSTDLMGKSEPAIEHIDKKLERNLSFEIKKVPLQEGPKSFDGNTLLNRGHAIKIKSASSCVVDKISKPQELNSGDLKVDDVSQNSCVDCSAAHSDKAPDSSEESQRNSHTPPRPDCLPLDKKGHVTWSLHGPENATPDSPEGKSPENHSQTPRTVSSTPNSTAEEEAHDLTERPNSSPLLKAPLSFTNPLHSDDSDSDERSSDGAVARNQTSISAASATVSPASSAASACPRRVLPMSIARQEVAGTPHSDADVSEESPPPLPERTPESFVLADMPVRSEWHELASQEWSEQRESDGLITSGNEKHDTGGIHTGTCADSPPAFGDKKDQITESPAEVTDIGFGNRCGKPKGPRDPPSEWT